MNTSHNTSKTQRVGIAVFVATILVLTLIGAVCLIHYGSSIFSVYLLYAAGGLVIEAYVWNTFIFKRRECSFGLGSPKLLCQLLLTDIAAALVAEVGTLIGSRIASPLRLSDWSLARIFVFFFVALVLTLIYAEYGPRKRSERHALLQTTRAFKDSLRHGLRLALPLFGYAVAYLFVFLTDNNSGVSWVSVGALLAAFAAAVIAIVSMALDRSWTPERTFAWIALAMGLAFILPFPVTNLFSWDDEVHYRTANSLSYVTNAEQSASDRMISTVYAMEDGFEHDASFGRFYTDTSRWSDDDIVEFAQDFTEQGNDNIVISDPGMSSVVARYASIGYVPCALGLWLGRLLHLPYALTFVLGRLANLIAYTVVTYYAIKLIPTKKVLLCVVALLPTNVFLAANYSYDPWLTSWLFLAVSLTIREIKSSDPLDASRWGLLLLTYFVALGPKAVYFPIIALLMLVPNAKFPSARQKRHYYAAAIAMALLIVGTFALNLLLTGGGAGDSRGGENVSTSGQVASVTQSPVDFLCTITSFLFGEYLSLNNFAFAFTALSYIGYPSELYPVSACLLVLFVVIIALVEGSERHDPLAGIGKSLWTLFLCLATLFLSSVALYLSFTSVGASTVAGMQPRYMLPLVFPLCALTLNFPHDWRLPDKTFAIASLSLSTLYLVGYTWLCFSSTIVT